MNSTSQLDQEINDEEIIKKLKIAALMVVLNLLDETKNKELTFKINKKNMRKIMKKIKIIELTVEENKFFIKLNYKYVKELPEKSEKIH